MGLKPPFSLNFGRKNRESFEKQKLVCISDIFKNINWRYPLPFMTGLEYMGEKYGKKEC
jgi:hypothetical protein